MDTFYIITNYQKDPDLETAQAIQQYLEKKGKTCYIQSNEAGDNGGAYKYTDASRVPDEVECVLVIGGVGTLLRPGIWWSGSFRCSASTWERSDTSRRSTGKVSVRHWRS